MNKKHYLVSFCNNKHNISPSNDRVLGKLSIDLESLHIEFNPIQLNLPNNIIAKGITGITHFNEYFAAVIQNKNPIVVFLDQDFQYIDHWDIGHLKGVHTILQQKNRLLFSVTGNDLISSSSDGINFNTVWSNNTNTDTIHLNSICQFNDNIYFTAFGNKNNSNLWSSAENGSINQCTHQKPIKNNIWHPHSLTQFAGKLYFCNSCNQSVESIDKTILDRLPGYTRGLYIDSDQIIVGTSKGRLVSHSTGIILSNSSDDGKTYGICGITIYHKSSNEKRFINLDKYANEIFDIISLNNK